MNPEFAAVMMSLVSLAGLSDAVEGIVGPSDASIARLCSEGRLSHIYLMFLDLYKLAYIADLQLYGELRLVRHGTVLTAGNAIKPWNPPYLEYVRKSVQEKRKQLGETGKGEGMPDQTVQQYRKRS